MHGAQDKPTLLYGEETLLPQIAFALEFDLFIFGCLFLVVFHIVSYC